MRQAMDSGLAPDLFGASGRHPRIFCGPEDLAGWRARCQAGIPGRAFAELRRRADALCDPASPGYLDIERASRAELLSIREKWGYGAANNRGGPLHILSFAAAIGADPRHLAHARRFMCAAASPPPVPPGIGPLTGPHGARYKAAEPVSTAAANGDLPLAFDLLHEHLDAAERALIAGHLRRNVVEPYRRDYLANPRLYAASLGMNPPWHEMTVYAWTLAAVYDPLLDAGAFEELAWCLRLALHQGVDAAGMIGEGPNYGRHDAWRWTTLAEILKRAGSADFWRREPLLTRLLEHWADLLLPGRREIMNVADSGRHSGTVPDLHLLLGARATGSPLLQYAWERLSGRGEIPGHGPVPECLESLGFVTLWERDDAKAGSPQDLGRPLDVAAGDFGVSIMRGGWGTDDLYFALLAAGRRPGCLIHQHLDAGHFTLFALGEAFSIESGYGDSRGAYHSVMLPNGQEPPCSPLHFDQVYPGGRTTVFADSATAAYAKIDSGWQWDCFWAYRHALLIRAPGAEPFVLLLDNMNYRAKFSFYTWLVNTEPGNRIELNEAESRAAIHGRTNRCEVLWSFPPPEAYPSAHFLELAADELDSTPLHHQHHRLGIGRHPRLKATLHGYNGLLLSALLPRRAGMPAAGVERLYGANQFGLVIDHGEVTDTVLVNPQDGRLDAGGLKGEAVMAVARRDRAGRLLWWAAAEAYELAVDGSAVLAFTGEKQLLRQGEWKA